MIAGQQNRPDDAIRKFKQSLSQRPDYTVALVNLGNIYRRQGNVTEASDLFDKALALEPENAEAIYSLGMLYARQNDSAHAIELLQKAVRIRPDYANTQNNLGVLYVRAGRNTEAEAQFKQSGQEKLFLVSIKPISISRSFTCLQTKKNKLRPCCKRYSNCSRSTN